MTDFRLFAQTPWNLLRLFSSRRRAGGEVARAYLGTKALTRQGVVAILRRRVLRAIDSGTLELEGGVEGETPARSRAHSFRVGLTQDMFGADEDGSGVALALRWSSPTTALRYARSRGQQCGASVGGRADPEGGVAMESAKNLGERTCPRPSSPSCLHVAVHRGSFFAIQWFRG